MELLHDYQLLPYMGQKPVTLMIVITLKLGLICNNIILVTGYD